MHKYNIYSSTTETHHTQQNPDEWRIQLCNKNTNNTLDQTVDTSYMWLYDLLIWVGIYNFLSEHYHGY